MSNEVDLSKLRSLTVKKLISALKRDGFYLDRASGSHQQYYHPITKKRVTISFHHPSDTLPPKTLKMILEDAGWTKEDLKRLKLLK
jgi:predicted RNA binding protein YcfA (HicA-like mRNA interferase family)